MNPFDAVVCQRIAGEGRGDGRRHLRAAELGAQQWNDPGAGDEARVSDKGGSCSREIGHSPVLLLGQRTVS
jgi:hypothetical protein